MTKDKYDVFIKGRDIDLVCLNEEIIEKDNWYNWFNDEDTTRFMQKHYFPNTRTLQLQFYKNEIENNRAKLQLGILEKKDQILIGTISLNNIDMVNRKCETSGFIGEAKYRNFKYFIEATRLIVKHAFDSLNMHKVYAGGINKEVALLYCRGLGFTQEGVKRSEVYKNGQYYDAYYVGILKEEFQPGENSE